MQQHKRSTKLEEAQLKVHLDIDGDKSEALDSALHQIRQVIQLIIGQPDLPAHDVSLVMQVVIREQTKSAEA